MKPIRYTLSFCFALLFISCSTDSEDKEEDKTVILETREAYFPPIGSDAWETLTMKELNWNEAAVQPLLDYLESKDTKAFLVLKDGRMVLESYFNGSDAADNNAWNSAGKTLTAMTIGIAQEEGFLSLEDSSAEFLGAGWSGLTPTQQNNIRIRNHLTMTTGLDYTVENNFCTDADCLQYLNEPDTYWFYHQGTYTVLDQLVTTAVGQNLTRYFNQKIRNRIGMQGTFVELGFNNVYFSTARSMARFGILNLNRGVWDGTPILGDSDYFDAMTTTSQQLNPAYGYLYWLNGKNNYRIPASEEEFTGKLIPNAPDDLYAGLGANDQKLYVVPSQKLVVIRMGNDASESNLGPSSFDDELWGLINNVID